MGQDCRVFPEAKPWQQACVRLRGDRAGCFPRGDGPVPVLTSLLEVAIGVQSARYMGKVVRVHLRKDPDASTLFRSRLQRETEWVIVSERRAYVRSGQQLGLERCEVSCTALPEVRACHVS
ncbi:unnamed protein product [Gadus morhua 'NCC']